jgi:hypothetical protein
MDNIWRKAAKNICKREERLAAVAATTITPIYTNPTIFALTEENMNTVEKIDAQLARMEQNWAQTRSGPFPERAQNAIARLRASLEEQDTETIPLSQPAPAVDVRHVSTTTSLPTPANTATPTTTTTTTNIPAPANTAIPAIHETTTTREQLDRVTDARHVTTPSTPAPVTTPAPAAEGKAEGDEIVGDERDIPPGSANSAIEEIEGSPEGRASEGRNSNEEEKETRTEECEKSARIEIPEMRRGEGGEGEQIARRVRAKEGENEKSETASEGIEES